MVQIAKYARHLNISLKHYDLTITSNNSRRGRDEQSSWLERESFVGFTVRGAFWIWNRAKTFL